jgi:hypothetical protein
MKTYGNVVQSGGSSHKIYRGAPTSQRVTLDARHSLSKTGILQFLLLNVLRFETRDLRHTYSHTHILTYSHTHILTYSQYYKHQTAHFRYRYGSLKNLLNVVLASSPPKGSSKVCLLALSENIQSTDGTSTTVLFACCHHQASLIKI